MVLGTEGKIHNNLDPPPHLHPFNVPTKGDKHENRGGTCFCATTNGAFKFYMNVGIPAVKRKHIKKTEKYFKKPTPFKKYF